MSDDHSKPAPPEKETKKVKPEVKVPEGQKPRGLLRTDDLARVNDPKSPRPNTSRVKATLGYARPGAIIGSVRADISDRPPAVPIASPAPFKSRVEAFTNAEILSRWEQGAAGIRALEQGDNVITMLEMIGEDYWSGGGVTAKKVASQLRAIGGRPVEVQINSPGGDMFEGLAIYNILREHPYPVTVKVIGYAASAASIIAMAGDTIQIGAASFLMIHNCWVLAAGNRHDMRAVADYLEPFDTAMATVYAHRAGQPNDVAKFADLMDKESWIAGAAAIELGLADELLPADKVTVDSDAKATDKDVNRLRATEVALMQVQGLSRSAARSHIKALRGTTDSALRDGTMDSAEDEPTTPDFSTATSLLEGVLASLKG